MITRIVRALVSLAALISFVFVGGHTVNACETWECLCTNVECEWCDGEFTWDDFHADALAEYADEFTALFNSYEVKRAKNGAMMIRQGDSGSFKFARKS